MLKLRTNLPINLIDVVENRRSTSALLSLSLGSDLNDENADDNDYNADDVYEPLLSLFI